MKTKYFIVSLPRTGTKSLCKMTQILGFTFKHVPSCSLNRFLREDEIDVFADTPIFTPSTFTSLLNDNENYKFIYIDRPADEWVESFERVHMVENYMALHTNQIDHNAVNLMDRHCLEEIFQNSDYTRDLAVRSYYKHKDTVYNTIPESKLLTYDFSMGWNPLCEFMGVKVEDNKPLSEFMGVNTPIPHINKNTIYEKIL